MMGLVPNVRKYRVAFTDSDGVTHSVELAASSLYEAVAPAGAEFRRCGFAVAEPVTGTRLTFAVEAPATTHRLTFAKLSAWLDGGDGGTYLQSEALQESIQILTSYIPVSLAGSSNSVWSGTLPLLRKLVFGGIVGDV